ncbi:Phosphoglucan phosphatase LSF2, chloroplastic [Porphyridium purpureum]|uniref:Phosphoglucan phosphatase LSF2, chloroplastic n=1 Tax=Porphyridium purpureum TaxID=35688 RepID=A0A5J4Z347_PORPP|nr:Phosphoglucan phosphatase LSF2, chloroplastic [Porphyridium purpureum]|eukprot:POR3638..scf295_1
MGIITLMCRVPAAHEQAACQMYVCGSAERLGGWDPQRALPATRESPDGLFEWDLPALDEVDVHYKYVLKPREATVQVPASATVPDVVWWPLAGNLVLPDPAEISQTEQTVLMDQPIGLRFKMYKDLSFNQTLAVCGELHELGAWKPERAFRLHCSAPNKWIGTVYLPCRSVLDSSFQAKFLIVPSSGERIQDALYEAGPNRSCRIRPLLEKYTAVSETVMKGDSAECELYSCWEGFMMRLVIFHPLPDPLVLGVIGSFPEMGDWSKPVPMGTGPLRRTKTGGLERCWELTFPVTNVADRSNPVYRYAQLDVAKNTAIWEREPNRSVDLPKGSPVENGLFEIFDANFVSEMDIDRITNKIVLGPYPQSAQDIEQIRASGSSAVLNVQTDHDFAQRQIDWPTIEKCYADLAMPCVRVPILDFHADSLRSNLEQAAAQVKQLVDEGHTVYIHCTAGMGRAPAVAILYLARYEGIDPDKGLGMIRAVRPKVGPNMTVIKSMC